MRERRGKQAEGWEWAVKVMGKKQDAEKRGRGTVGARRRQAGMGVQRAMQGRCKGDARVPQRQCGEVPMGLTPAATRIRR